MDIWVSYPFDIRISLFTCSQRPLYCWSWVLLRIVFKKSHDITFNMMHACDISFARHWEMKIHKIWASHVRLETEPRRNRGKSSKEKLKPWVKEHGATFRTIANSNTDECLKNLSSMSMQKIRFACMGEMVNKLLVRGPNRIVFHFIRIET